MSSTAVPESSSLTVGRHRPAAAGLFCLRLPSLAVAGLPSRWCAAVSCSAAGGGLRSRRSFAVASNGSALMSSSNLPKCGDYTVSDFMTTKDSLLVVKPSTTVDEALELVVENRISGLPVVDDDWTLVGVVSDYDLLALDSVSGSGKADGSIFPEVDSNWKVFNELQNLLTKTNGKLVSDVMTVAPLVIRERTNLEDAARLLLETKYRRLPVVDSHGKLVGIITRGDVIRAAIQVKREAATTLN